MSINNINTYKTKETIGHSIRNMNKSRRTLPATLRHTRPRKKG